METDDFNRRQFMISMTMSSFGLMFLDPIFSFIKTTGELNTTLFSQV